MLRGQGEFRRWRSATIGQYLLLLGIVWMFDILTQLSAYSEDEATRWDGIQFAMTATITFTGFAVLTFARLARMDARTWLHVAIGGVNLVAVALVVALGAGLRVTALVSIALVAADSLLSVRLAESRVSQSSEVA